MTSTRQRDWRSWRSGFLGPHRFQSGGESRGPAIQFERAALCESARPLGRVVSCSLFPRACGSASQMDKVCAVFGGSRGIGRAVARLMAQRGYRLAIVARNLEGARAAAGDLGGGYRPGAHPLFARPVWVREAVLGALPAMLGEGWRRRARVSRGGPRVCACAGVPPRAAGGCASTWCAWARFPASTASKHCYALMTFTKGQ